MLRRACWPLTALLSACFHPHYTDTRCSTTGECPNGLKCTLEGLCESPGAAPQDAAPDAPVFCYGTAPFTICLAQAPTAPLTIDMPTTLDTVTSAMCAPLANAGGDYCVIAAATITIHATLRGTGARPLVLLARDTITTTTAGVIDVSSHRLPTEATGAGADPGACAPGTPPTTSTVSASGGGGAGGSFMGPGGHGGNAGASGTGFGGTPGAVVTSAITIRGGCRGQDGAGPSKGAGGHGGGAVFLIAGNSINVAAPITAAGEGGDGGAMAASGGGGGGAGGMIGFDAPTVTVTGLLLANGGGGGEGSGTGTQGSRGADAFAMAAAAGGSGGSNVGGDGGDGSTGAAAGGGSSGRNGEATSTNGGGGGGGGGAGLIKAPASANLGTQVSPAATP